MTISRKRSTERSQSLGGVSLAMPQDVAEMARRVAHPAGADVRRPPAPH